MFPDDQQWAYYIKNLLAGGVAGCCAKTTIAPLDRVKILLQARHKHYLNLGVWSSINHVVDTEGFTALYKGNGAMMVRIFPYGAIQFTTYEWFKHKTKRKLLSGSLAGMCAVISTYPLDMIRARLAYQVKGEHIYKGILHASQSIWQQEGKLKGFYRGVTPTLLGMIPYAGTAFYSYETAKNFIIENGPPFCIRTSTTDSEVQMLTPAANLVAGAFAGTVAQTVSYPLDVVRRMMQLGEMVPHHSKGGVEILVFVYKKHGIRGLYRGLTINYIRAVPTAAVSFTVYEYMKEILNVQTVKKVP